MPQICPILDKSGAAVVLSIFTQGMFSGLHSDHCLSILRLYAHNDNCVQFLLERRLLDVISIVLKAEPNVTCMSLLTDGMIVLMNFSTIRSDV